MRFVIDGTWSGYRSSQQRVVHRTVHKAECKRLREWAVKTSAIRYTDGTCLIISVRYCKPGERVQEIHGYDSLIEECAHYNVASVDDLYKKKEAAKAKA